MKGSGRVSREVGRRQGPRGAGPRRERGAVEGKGPCVYVWVVEMDIQENSDVVYIGKGGEVQEKQKNGEWREGDAMEETRWRRKIFVEECEAARRAEVAMEVLRVLCLV